MDEEGYEDFKNWFNKLEVGERIYIKRMSKMGFASIPTLMILCDQLEYDGYIKPSRNILTKRRIKIRKVRDIK